LYFGFVAPCGESSARSAPIATIAAAPAATAIDLLEIPIADPPLDRKFDD
jgi:hypothetical protein